MAIAKEIRMTRAGENKSFPNNFKQFKLSDKDINLVNGDNYFQLDVDITTFDLVYLYLVVDIDVDIDMEIFRSPDVNSLDTKYAVPVPGGTLTLPAAGESADFSVSLFGAEKLWLKVSAATFNKGKNKITDMYLNIKK